MVSASRRSSSHSSHRFVSTASVSSPLTSITSFGTGLQQFTQLYDDLSPILGPQVVAERRRATESSERDQDAGQHLRREAETPHPREGPVAEPQPIRKNEFHGRQEFCNQSSDADSPCPSLSTHDEVDTDSGESATRRNYGSFSPDVAHELASLVRLLVSFWFCRVWPNVRDSAATPFRSCTGSAGNTNAGSGAYQSSGGPSTPQYGTARTTKRSRKDADADDPEDHGQKRGKRNRSHSDSNVPLLACPFSKYDPLRYSEVNIAEREYRGCSTPCLTDISRLKYETLRSISVGLYE